MRAPDAGVTLVEALVALAVVAAIGAAGLGLVEAVAGVREATGGRLARIAAVERTVSLFVADIETALPGTLAGDADAVALRRADSGRAVRWTRQGTVLRREIASAPDSLVQSPLDGVGAAVWRYATAGGEWSDDWPPAADAAAMPRAVELVLELTDARALPGALRVLAEPPAAPPLAP